MHRLHYGYKIWKLALTKLKGSVKIIVYEKNYEYKKKYLEYKQAHLKKNLKKGNKQNETSDTNNWCRE